MDGQSSHLEFLRKVGFGERPEMRNCGHVIGARSILGSVKTAEFIDFSLPHHPGSEPALRKRHAFEWDFCGTPTQAISEVFRLRTDAEVVASVVQAIVVDVIYNAVIGGLENETVQEHSPPLNFGGCINMVTAGGMYMPRVERYASEILFVDKSADTSREEHFSMRPTRKFSTHGSGRLALGGTGRLGGLGGLAENVREKFVAKPELVLFRYRPIVRPHRYGGTGDAKCVSKSLLRTVGFDCVFLQDVHAGGLSGC